MQKSNYNIVNYSVSLEYPGSKKRFFVKLTNDGSISAKVDYNSIIAFMNTTLKRYNSDTNELINELKFESDTNFVEDYGIYFFEDANGIYGDQDEKYMNFIDVNTMTITLNPDESLYLGIGIQWPTSN